MKYNNILVFVCDQLSGKALPFNGNTYVKTPNMDRIRSGGINFESCYCSFPLCQPSRASFWTSLYPHETKVISNGRRWPIQAMPEDTPTVGKVFQEAGYQTVHFGKRHSAGGLRGFECVEQGSVEFPSDNPALPNGMAAFQDQDTALKAAEFIKNSDDRPFFLVASFHNPHDICGYIGKYRDKHTNPDLGMPLPELPENFEFDDIENRPKAVQYICCSHNRQAQTGEWEPEDFRYYLAAYYHDVQLVDRQIGMVLDALEASGKENDTLIVLMSDHGEGMAEKRLVTKQVAFYESVTRVPFAFRGPGVIDKTDNICEYPVSTLDLFPTLCGYAGLEIPESVRGVDLSPILRGKRTTLDREYVASEWHTEWGFTVSPGRMIRTPEYKYTCYIEDNREELFDMLNDPLEKKNLVSDSKYTEVLDKMRSLFNKHLEETNDDFRSQEWIADIQWRSHRPGYQNHRGPGAPEAIEPKFDFAKERRYWNM